MKTSPAPADRRPFRSHSPPSAHRPAGRAAAPFVRGFGTLIRQVHTLQFLIEAHQQATPSRHSAEIGPVLESQRSLIATGIRLLERCCALLPHPERFRALGRVPPMAPSARPEAGQSSLAHIVAQHLSLRGGIDALAEQRTEEEPGELLLAQVARNHARMAWTLAALLRSDETGRAREARADAGNWENEGGALEFNPSVVRSRLLPTGAGRAL